MCWLPQALSAAHFCCRRVAGSEEPGASSRTVPLPRTRTTMASLPCKDVGQDMCQCALSQIHSYRQQRTVKGRVTTAPDRHVTFNSIRPLFLLPCTYTLRWC